MSAIAGMVNLDGSPADKGLLHAMTDIVRHRGPDGIGHWVEGTVGLGHLQLVTTPEARHERQPLVSPDGKHVLVWDGRLDNREQLADALRTQRPLSQLTDADLVLKAYRTWGWQAPARLVGDFAFVVWDGVRQELLCARDPIGVRPFHYHYDGRRFLFGTEIKQIFQGAAVPRCLNETMLGLFLCGNFGDGEMTFWEGVKRLPGGYTLVVSRNGLGARRFWDPDPYDEIKYPKQSDYADHFRGLILEATHCRLRSSTGVEVLLSGGVDSGSVASVAGLLREQGASDAPLSALTCVYEGAPLDETPYVRLISERYGTPVTWLSVDDCWAMKPVDSRVQWDEPFRMHFEAMHVAQARSASERGIRVLLTGEGGDETSLLGVSMLHIRDWVRRGQLRSLWKDLSGATPKYRHAALRAIRRTLTPRWMRRPARHSAGRPPWVRQEFLSCSAAETWLARLEPQGRRDGRHLQQRGRNPVFLEGDARGSAYGIEFRHPLHDVRVVEFLVRVSPTIRFRGGRSKPLLRRAMAGVMPDDLVHRTPHGAFSGLAERGLRVREVTRLKNLLQDSRLAELGVLEPLRLLSAYDAYLAGDGSQMGGAIRTFLTEQWLQEVDPPRDHRTPVLFTQPSRLLSERRQ